MSFIISAITLIKGNYKLFSFGLIGIVLCAGLLYINHQSNKIETLNEQVKIQSSQLILYKQSELTNKNIIEKVAALKKENKFDIEFTQAYAGEKPTDITIKHTDIIPTNIMLLLKSYKDK